MLIQYCRVSLGERLAKVLTVILQHNETRGIMRVESREFVGQVSVASQSESVVGSHRIVWHATTRSHRSNVEAVCSCVIRSGRMMMCWTV